MKSFSKAKIISRQMLTEDICSLWAEVPFAGMAHAGQVVGTQRVLEVDVGFPESVRASENIEHE